MTDRLVVRGRAVEVRWWGEPGRRSRPMPPLVLLHEGLGSVAMWRDFPGKLAERMRRRVMAYSRLGHGTSDVPAAPHTTRFMHEEATEWLPAILDAARPPAAARGDADEHGPGIDRAVLVGHSDGASIALIFAATHPARVPQLVLEAPHVFVEDVSIASIAQTKIRYQSGGLRERLARYHRHVDVAFHGWHDVWLDPEFRDWNLEPYLPRVTCPVLVIQGERDEYGTLRQVDAIARQAAGPVTPLILPGCGHAPHRDREDAVLTAIAEFAARAPQSRSTAG